MKETRVYVDELPENCFECPIMVDGSEGCDFCVCAILEEKAETKNRLKDCPLKSLHEHNKELVAKVLGMVRENLKEELLLTKNENQEEAKLKLVKSYSIDLDVLDQIQKEFEK